MALYIFDKDGTLVKKLRTRVGVTRSAVSPEEQILMPRVFEKVEKLRAAGHKIAIASNQGDVAHGITTVKQSQQLMENCAAKIGGADAVRFSPYDPKAKKKIKGRPNPYARDDASHKPHPGMIIDLMKTLRASPKETIMVGDGSKDRKAAQAAEVRFIRAKDFFKKI